jgi:ABC-2 type transport system ATP-binding protein
LNDYFDHSRTILVTTHQVDEIEDILTDVMFLDRGRLVLDCSMDQVEKRYVELMAPPEQAVAARALGPLRERQLFGRNLFIFDGAERGKLAGLGELRTPSISDLFVAMMSAKPGVAA